MTSWKRDFASGLVVLGPILVSLYVILWLYGVVADVAPESFLGQDAFMDIIENNDTVRLAIIEFLRVVATLTVFVILTLSIGYLMRTTVGVLVERVVDNSANRVPGLRVVYNASKMAAETAFGQQEALQTPVKLETWNGLRMTAFKTGRVTEDGREVLFLPTSPNITTGYVVEVDPDRITEIDEKVEDALTRVLSAGFGDSNGGRGMGAGIPIDVVDEQAADGDDD